MSVVTDIIITCSLGEESDEDVFPAIDFLNRYLTGEGKGTLSHLNGHEGGSKSWQVDVFGGAFNYLHLEEFASMLRSAPWIIPEEVTILIQEEEEEVMREVRLLSGSSPYNRSAERLQSLLDSPPEVIE